MFNLTLTCKRATCLLCSPCIMLSSAEPYPMAWPWLWWTPFTQCSKSFTILPNIHPFLDTFTHRWQGQPRKATASLSGAVRDTSTLSQEKPGIELATSLPTLPPEPHTTLSMQWKKLLSPPSFSADPRLSLQQSIELLSPNVASVRDLYLHPDGVRDNVLYQRNWLLTSGVGPRIHKGIRSRDYTGTVAYRAGTLRWTV